MSESELQEAAKWIWDRKDSPTTWWTHIVLTSKNTDPNSLGLDNTPAFQIFTILEERRLILPTTATVGSYIIPAYKLNYDKAKEWEDLITKKGVLKLYIFPFLKSVFNHGWLLTLWFITLILASTIQSLIKNIIDNIFK